MNRLKNFEKLNTYVNMKIFQTVIVLQDIGQVEIFNAGVGSHE